MCIQNNLIFFDLHYLSTHLHIPHSDGPPQHRTIITVQVRTYLPVKQIPFIAHITYHSFIGQLLYSLIAKSFNTERAEPICFRPAETVNYPNPSLSRLPLRQKCKIPVPFLYIVK